MTFLIIFLCIVLTVVVLVQLGKVTELANTIRGEEEALEDNNTRQAFFGMVFLVFFFILGIGSAIYYKNWMLGYGPHSSASVHGDALDYMFDVTLVITGIVFLLTHIALFWYAWKYRGRKGRKALFMPHDTKLEIIWTAIPSIVMCFLVVNGLMAWNEVMGDDGDEDIEIEATGSQFAWQIRYPGADGVLGAKDYKSITPLNSLGQVWTDEKNLDDMITDQIWLPKGKKVRVRITAKDVLHNFDLPHFRVKMDAIPGLPTYFYFTPKVTTEEYRENLSKYPEYQQVDPNNPEKKLWETFNYDLACAELCGSGHYAMKKIVKIVEQEEYDAWFAQQKSNYFSSGVRFSDEDPYKDDLFEFEAKAQTAEFNTVFDSTLLSKTNKTILLDKVEFEFGKNELTSMSRYQLTDLVNKLKNNTNVMVELAGHTDNVGSDANNLALSQARAGVVYEYLTRKGISADRLRAVGYGEEKPIATNETDAGRQDNRRTEARIIAQ